MLRYQPSIRYQGQSMSGTNIYADKQGKRKKRRIRDCESNKSENKRKSSKEKSHVHGKVEIKVEENVSDAGDNIEDVTDEANDAVDDEAVVDNAAVDDKEVVAVLTDASTSTVGEQT